MLRPLQHSEGFSHVVVNGRIVVDDGKILFQTFTAALE